MNRNMLNPTVSILLATFIWSMNGVLIQWMGITPQTMTLFRMLVPTLLCIFYLRPNLSFFKRPFLFIMLLSSFLSIFRLFFYYAGFTYTDVSQAIVLLYVWPIFVVLLNLMLRRERLTRKSALYLLMAFMGVVFMHDWKVGFSLENQHVIGMCSMLICSLITAIDVLLMKSVIDEYKPAEIIFFQNLVGAIFLFPFLWIFPEVKLAATWIKAIPYAIMVGIVGYAFFYHGLKYLSSSKVSVLSYLEVILTAFFGIIFFKESPGIWGGLGAVLIIISTFLVKSEKDVVIPVRKKYGL